MIRCEPQCADCGFPCRREACPNYRTRILVCDKCMEEKEALYVGLSGMELCSDCALEELEKVSFF